MRIFVHISWLVCPNRNTSQIERAQSVADLFEQREVLRITGVTAKKKVERRYRKSKGAPQAHIAIEKSATTPMATWTARDCQNIIVSVATRIMIVKNNYTPLGLYNTQLLPPLQFNNIAGLNGTRLHEPIPNAARHDPQVDKIFEMNNALGVQVIVVIMCDTTNVKLAITITFRAILHLMIGKFFDSVCGWYITKNTEKCFERRRSSAKYWVSQNGEVIFDLKQASGMADPRKLKVGIIRGW
mmetsp:Transcript_17291/g.37873  ORF Transcript_17291/g.37873 Transcript_17291/m.37873 type:complete len:242 (+) Transcript_17291:305-1030(+)